MRCFQTSSARGSNYRILLPWRRSFTQFVLRPYQQACLDACHAALRAGITRIGVSLPTGAGKTPIFTTLLSQIFSPRPSQPFGSLIIVNSVELARQAAAQAEMTHPHWKVELEQGISHQASGRADVWPQRLAKFRPENLKAIIVDEAHHAAAPSYRRILSHFNADIKNPDPHFVPPFIPHPIPVIGFSATFSRHDGLALGSVFEKIVYHRDFLDMINEQWQVICMLCVEVDRNLTTGYAMTGDFNATSLAHIINTETINNLVVQAWLDRASSERKSTLVFCVNLAHVGQLTKTFREFGIDARQLHSNTPAIERRTLITEFKAGCYPVLVNCAILTEGADIPNVDCIVICRPTRSRNLYAQMIGRGMRQSHASGKVDCRIIDFVDSTSRICGIVSIPTLLGLDPSEIVDDASIADLRARAASIKSCNTDNISVESDCIPEPTSVTYLDYGDPFAMVDSFSGAPHVSRLSPNAWVGCGSDIYVLECLGKGYIRIEPDSEGEASFRSTYTEATMHFSSAKRLKVSPFMRKRLVSTADTLSDALKGCDTYARQKVLRGPLVLGLLRSARWRQAPATESQKTFINRRRGKRAMDRASITEATEGLTKGQAANIITRLKHGAQAHYEKKMKEDRRRSQLAEKERLRVARSTVRVGLLDQQP
ncbi:P-loop containing nucleoside triphosphate hydrolase protein [Boletus reticuloceps]|uniref:P-loop containing nucleoside triphosphate hydrolase protein n=1 Tax=Boletus reticuloceps TaxID=495285 RepID=A0A8I2YZ51_9AGAM|nr:P-loop containing nucleoside triphosphate hydrolase protein [Boletus reticuloceps]